MEPDRVVLVRKILLIVTLLAAMVVAMGWIPKERVSRLMWFTATVFVLGFLVRVGSWYLSF